MAAGDEAGIYVGRWSSSKRKRQLLSAARRFYGEYLQSRSSAKGRLLSLKKNWSEILWRNARLYSQMAPPILAGSGGLYRHRLVQQHCRAIGSFQYTARTNGLAVTLHDIKSLQSSEKKEFFPLASSDAVWVKDRKGTLEIKQFITLSFTRSILRDVTTKYPPYVALSKIHSFKSP